MSVVKTGRPLYTLSAVEQSDPNQVVDELFDFAAHPELKQLLWTWLKVTVTGTYHKELSSHERSAILSLYEKMEKLVDAAHVMHLSSKDNLHVRRSIKIKKRRGKQ